MNQRLYFLTAFFLGLLAATTSAPSQSSTTIPHLAKQGAATQLIVDGKPYLVLAGELNNSSASSLEYLQPLWPRLAATHFNTVLATVTWELIEPREGKFDFALVDGLLQQARHEHQRIVFLWLASWKNGMSSYPPVW